MDAAAVNRPKPTATELLLAHCTAFAAGDERSPSAAVRLEALLGRELAHRLVAALSTRAARRVL